MLTQRAALLGFVAFCFYLIAVVNTVPTFYFVLTWLAVAMLGASLGIALLALVGVDFQFEVVRSRALSSFSPVDGGSPQVRLQISNRGTLNKTGILLILGLRDAQNRRIVQRFVIEAVPSGGAIEAIVPLSDLKRGFYRLEEAHLTGSDVLGLFRMRKRFAPAENSSRDIIVGPPVLRGEKLEVSVGGGARNGSRRTVQTGQGEELRGTRPYSPGDDLRHVHWKSSARAGELVVKEFEQTGRSTALVVWDGAAGTTWGDGEWNSTEWSLTLCASLCHILLANGTPCDFARLDESPLLVSARGLSNDSLPVAFIDALAGACAERKTSLESAVQAIFSRGARSHSLVLLVSASPNADVSAQARFWRGRGARVQVVLVDAAALINPRDRRSRSRAARSNQGDKIHTAAVTIENYTAQLARLREDGFEVVRVAPTKDEPDASLRAALREISLSRPFYRPTPTETA
jgi:uncharacterized protein (DUF58 family)